MDALLNQIFSEKDMPVHLTLTAVYRVSIIRHTLFTGRTRHREYRDEIVAGCDEFTSRDKETNEILLICKSFKGLKGEVDGDGCGGQREDPLSLAVQSRLGGVDEGDLIWCTKPRRFVLASTYVMYGNDMEHAHSYVSAAVIVEVPKIGEGCRTGAIGRL